MFVYQLANCRTKSKPVPFLMINYHSYTISYPCSTKDPAPNNAIPPGTQNPQPRNCKIKFLPTRGIIKERQERRSIITNHIKA
ncbi:hypothetical protein EYC84_006848 [Monilinia fructicola]|uniref:Uncharacterized protein n=1 Tax=Monilinia fructicola TaxID=38448 RepID=A0A5M9K4Q6_MONFR|nr:hypothetical protein EYC84_006848 [Monilinia fructicola]